MTTPLSWALQEMVVQTCGTAFWYKDPLRQLLARAGVPAPLINKYWAESKYPMVRAILAELDSRGDHGILVQRRIVQELASIRRITDSYVDMAAAMEAIRALREAATEEGVLEDRSAETERAKERRSTATARLEAVEAQQKELARLCEMYGVLATRSDIAQRRGYDLEDLLGDLFKLYGIPYHAPYRKGTVEQTFQGCPVVWDPLARGYRGAGVGRGSRTESRGEPRRRWRVPSLMISGAQLARDRTTKPLSGVSTGEEYRGSEVRSTR
jgi:hypothetical protein